MSVSDFAKQYITRGWAPVPIPRGSKGPIIDGWQKLRVTSAEVPDYFRPDCNVGVLRGEPSGWLIDVDPDHDRNCLVHKWIWLGWTPRSSAKLETGSLPARCRRTIAAFCCGEKCLRVAIEKLQSVVLKPTGPTFHFQEMQDR